jgi:hypothetical protein
MEYQTAVTIDESAPATPRSGDILKTQIEQIADLQSDYFFGSIEERASFRLALDKFRQEIIGECDALSAADMQRQLDGVLIHRYGSLLYGAVDSDTVTREVLQAIRDVPLTLPQVIPLADEIYQAALDAHMEAKALSYSTPAEERASVEHKASVLSHVASSFGADLPVAKIGRRSMDGEAYHSTKVKEMLRSDKGSEAQKVNEAVQGIVHDAYGVDDKLKIPNSTTARIKRGVEHTLAVVSTVAALSSAGMVAANASTGKATTSEVLPAAPKSSAEVITPNQTTVTLAPVITQKVPKTTLIAAPSTIMPESDTITPISVTAPAVEQTLTDLSAQSTDIIGNTVTDVTPIVATVSAAMQETSPAPILTIEPSNQVPVAEAPSTVTTPSVTITPAVNMPDNNIPTLALLPSDPNTNIAPTPDNGRAAPDQPTDTPVAPPDENVIPTFPDLVPGQDSGTPTPPPPSEGVPMPPVINNQPVQPPANAPAPTPPPAEVSPTPAPSTPKPDKPAPAPKTPDKPAPAPEVPTTQGDYLNAAQNMIDANGEWTNRGIAMKFFLDKGLSPTGAAALVGNFMQEATPLIDPTIAQPNGPGRGIAQWSVGGRFDSDGLNLINFAQSQGKPWTDYNTQLEFVWAELNSSSYGGILNQLQHAGRDRALATQIVSSQYEGAGVPELQTRIAYTSKVADQFNGYYKGILDKRTPAPEAPAPAPATPEKVGKVVYTNQLDPAFSDMKYEDGALVGMTACGAASLDMVANTIGNQPGHGAVMRTMLADGTLPEGGTSQTLIMDEAPKFGLRTEYITDYSITKMKQVIDAGGLITFSGRTGTNLLILPGHFVVVYAVDVANGTIQVADPGNPANNGKWFSLQAELNGSAADRANGGAGLHNGFIAYYPTASAKGSVDEVLPSSSTTNEQPTSSPDKKITIDKSDVSSSEAKDTPAIDTKNEKVTDSSEATPQPAQDGLLIVDHSTTADNTASNGVEVKTDNTTISSETTNTTSEESVNAAAQASVDVAKRAIALANRVTEQARNAQALESTH